MISAEEARILVSKGLFPIGTECVALDEALGRALAVDLRASRDLPPFSNSAMDGYAVRSTDLGAEHDPLEVVQVIAAGQSSTTPIRPGEAARIFTGAPMPPGADTVVIQENVTRVDDAIRFTTPPSPGANVRLRGEDISAGSIYMHHGQALTAGRLTMVAAQGLREVTVFAQPRVAILPNGDELVPIDSPLAPGQVPNTNAHMLGLQVRNAGGIPIIYPPIPDQPSAIAEALESACKVADLVLTTGGMSVGDFDYTRDALGADGDLSFYKVRLKPGKPLGLGRLKGTPILGLPGNPVSAFVGYELFGRVMTRILGGYALVDHPRFDAPLGTSVSRNRTRPEYMRCAVKDGVLLPWPRQGSGMISSLLEADALAIIEAGPGMADAGEVVTAVDLRV